MVGDGSYLMMAQELATAVQEGIKLTVVLLDNHGFSSIGGLSEAVGCAGFGTEYRTRTASGQLDGAPVPVDFAANAASLGARVIHARHARGAGAGATRGPRQRDHHGRRRPGGSRMRASAATNRGGTCRLPKPRRSPRSAKHARPTKRH